MGMLLMAAHPEDLMRNGAYQASKAGQLLGRGNAISHLRLTNMVGQIKALAFSIDAPLQIMLNNADEEFVPSC